MKQLSFSILRWSAIVPELSDTPSPDQIQQGLETLPAASRTHPEVRFLPTLFRRRCTRMSKLGIEVAFRCLNSEERSRVPCVFGSRYGESNLTCDILDTLARGETPSPLHFSLSVHNGVAGLFSIASGNRSASTSVAAGPHTFSAGLLEAIVSSKTKGGTPVFYCMVEEPLPSMWQPLTDETPSSFGLGLLVQSSDEGQFTIGRSGSALPSKGHQKPAQGMEFIAWLLSERSSLTFDSEQERYLFSKQGKSMLDSFSLNAEGM